MNTTSVRRSIFVLFLLILNRAASAQIPNPSRYYIKTLAGSSTIFTQGLIGDGAPATTVPLYRPSSIATDRAGNLHIVQYASVRKITQGSVSTVIGTGKPADFNTGVGGPAKQAVLRDLGWIAFDAQGAMVVSSVGYADPAVPQFYRVGGDGILNPVKVNWPVGKGFERWGGFTVDQAGNYFIGAISSGCDVCYDNQVLKISPQGTVSVLAGTHDYGFSGDGGPAISAKIGSVSSVAMDSKGNLYIVDGADFQSYGITVHNNAIRMVNPAGVITTIAGSAAPGFSGDGGPAAAAKLNSPSAIAIDAAGNIYIADTRNHRIRKINSSGTISTFAGNGTPGYSGDAGSAVNAQLNAPQSITVDSAANNVYIADTTNNVVRVVDSNGIIRTVAGNEGRATAQTVGLYDPTGLTFDSNGNLYIADAGRIRCLAPDGTVATIAGTGGDGCTAITCQAQDAHFDNQAGMAVDSTGNIYATNGSRVLRITPTGTVIDLQVPVRYATGIALDGKGNLYILDGDASALKMLSPTGQLTTIIPGGQPGFAGDGGPAGAAQLGYPAGLFIDSKGRIFIAEPYNNRVRMIDTKGTISTFAGNGQFGFGGDGGEATSAAIFQPFSVTGDPFGNIFILNESRIRLVTPDGIIRTIAGTDTGSEPQDYDFFLGDNGPAIPARFDTVFYPGLIVDPRGDVIFVDYLYARVRVLVPAELFSPGAVNAFSYVPGKLSPGEAVSILSPGIGPSTPLSGGVDRPSHVATSVGGVIVTFDGVPAPLLYVAANQINLVVPYSVDGKQNTLVEVSYNGKTTYSAQIPVVAAVPGIATSSALGGGQAAVVNQDGTINSRKNPAPKGSIIALFLTGTGQTTPKGIDGILAGLPLPAPIATIFALIPTASQQIDLRTIFVGNAPGSIGLTQLNVKLPDNTPSGDSVPILVLVGNSWSSAGVTVAVQ